MPVSWGFPSFPLLPFFVVQQLLKKMKDMEIPKYSSGIAHLLLFPLGRWYLGNSRLAFYLFKRVSQKTWMITHGPVLPKQWWKMQKIVGPWVIASWHVTKRLKQVNPCHEDTGFHHKQIETRINGILKVMPAVRISRMLAILLTLSFIHKDRREDC